LLAGLNLLFLITASGQQIGMTREEVKQDLVKRGMTAQSGSLFSKENPGDDLFTKVNDFGHIEFVFDSNRCHTILYAPDDMVLARAFISKLSKKFLTVDDEVWNGIENSFVVQIKLYLTSDNTALFVKKGTLN